MSAQLSLFFQQTVNMRNTSRLSYISLFSSAGIGCYGFKMENFDCIVTNDLLERRLNIQRTNHVCKYDTGYIVGDIQKKEIKDKIFSEIENFKIYEKKNDVDVIIATPPCQGMSVANHKKKNEKNRNSLVVQSIEIVNKINSRYFIFENVRSFLNTVCTDIDGKDKKIKEAIELNLGGKYHILFKVINFKEFGSNSSRTRTLVLGTRKDIIDVSPVDIFPDKKIEKTLRQVIGGLPALNNFGEISKNDIYHNFRPYAMYMLDWIKDLKEGESAFNNHISKKPYKLVNGKKIFNKNKNGDKYRKCLWDRVAPCIHTRNDILASQSTIHPRDNRVFSIRELMRMMTIPENFKWVSNSLEELNRLSLNEKRLFLSKQEMNIRQSIGEAVPTEIFRQIAYKIKNIEEKKKLKTSDINKLIKKFKLSEVNNLRNFIIENKSKYSISDLFKISELANAERLKNAAFYTRQDICFSLVKELPESEKFQEINIIEPSVGAGNFLPLLFEKYESVNKVNIDVVDIDKKTILILKELLKIIKKPENIEINFLNQDFLLNNFSKKYDIVIGNPPFGKVVKNPELLGEYKIGKYNQKTNNIFAYFIEEAMRIGNVVALISPKSLLSAPEFNHTRELLSQYKFSSLIDYGEKGFNDVKIETVSLVFDTRKKNDDSIVKIESDILNNIRYVRQNYIFSKNFPVWLLYRDNFFDKVIKRLKFNIFSVFRDRTITKKHTKSKGKYRVLKSRNIYDNEIINIDGYDSFIDDIENVPVGKYLNKTSCVLVPNLSYNPRACFLPKNSITDGSVAILQPKEFISKKDLSYYNSEEFRRFYLITRNLGTRSLNIDRNSVYFFGVKK